MPLMADDFDEKMNREREEFEKLLNANKNEYSKYDAKTQKEYEQYRAKVNEEFAKFLGKPWQELPKIKPINPPVEPDPPTPIIIDEDEDKLNPKPNPIEIDTVITPPAPTPQPEPIVPFIPKPIPTPQTDKLTFYGTNLEFARPNFKNLQLRNNSEQIIASTWNNISEDDYAEFIEDLLDIRAKLNLPAWGYFKLVDKSLTLYHPKSSDEHTFLLAFILTQSGYKIRLGYNSKNQLFMLFCSKGIIYGREGFSIDGEKYYTYEPYNENSARIAQVEFPSEKSLSLDIRYSPKFAFAPGNVRQIIVKDYPSISLKTIPNKNLIDFWNDYIDGSDSDSQFGRWAIQGNCPMSNNMKEELYPALRSKIKGLNQTDAANILLKVAQSFPYGYDIDEWGVNDRTFWVEETWHYPKSDCEDHAIHFSRLVRDLLNLNAVLIYYPGHLSCAIEITDGSAKGDYVLHEGKRYIVCDATCFYSPVGYTPPSLDNSKAVLIPLRKG